MRKDFTIGLVVPFATDTVPDEGLQMYPGVRFIPRGVGVRSLTPTGYDSAWEGILPAAEHLAKQDVDAIMVIGTSLTFYRGSDFHDQLLERLRTMTGLPVSTMSQAVVDGLRHFGARRIVVATAYADDVNDRLKAFLIAQGFEVLVLEGFGLIGFGEPGSKSEADIIALGSKVCTAAPAAEGLLISCGGLRTLGVAKPLEERHGIPVVSSTQAAFWAAMRLVGEDGHVGGPRAALGASDRRPCALRRFTPKRPILRLAARPIRAISKTTLKGSLMKARVTVTLKSGILDPQGKAIEGALKSLGVNGVASVRQGKVFDIEIEGRDRKQAEAALKQAADKLLANTLIENYDVKLLG